MQENTKDGCSLKNPYGVNNENTISCGLHEIPGAPVALTGSCDSASFMNQHLYTAATIYTYGISIKHCKTFFEKGSLTIPSDGTSF